jgi:type III pantothenate kinase
MLLVADVGNTNTVVGVFDGDRLLASWRLTSRREQTADEYGLFIETLLRTRGLQAQQIRAVAISNVVPPVQQTLEWMCEKYFGLVPYNVDPGVNTAIPLAVDNPREIGPDRIVNAVAARARYGPPLIIIDFGTATTFDCVTPKGEYLGGVIAPGIQISADALFARAAKLPRVEITKPPKVVGRNTVNSMQSGIVYGYVGLVDGLVERLRGELDYPCEVIATGGLAPRIASLSKCIGAVDEDLTLRGLRILHERNIAE